MSQKSVIVTLSVLVGLAFVLWLKPSFQGASVAQTGTFSLAMLAAVIAMALVSALVLAGSQSARKQ